MGMMDILSYKGLNEGMKWAWNIAFASSVFACATSTIGIIMFKEGPPFFILFVGLSSLIPLLLYRNEFKVRTLL
jgi:hypothetical protein